MKKMFLALVIIVSMYGGFGSTAASAATKQTVTIEMTFSSPVAGGSSFLLSGLQTSATPSFTCSKSSTMSAANGKSTGVTFAVVDSSGIDQEKITVQGIPVDKLVIKNDTYVDSSGNFVSGNINLRQIR